MTGRDYELVSDIIREMPKDQRNFAARHFVTRLKSQNRRFNTDRFLENCCITPTEEEEEA